MQHKSSTKHTQKRHSQTHHQRTPQSVEKYQSVAYQIRTGSSPNDAYQVTHQRLRNGSPSSFYRMQQNRSSPGMAFKNGLQFKQLVQQNQQRENSHDGFSEYSSGAGGNMNNLNSTKDNTKITIINAHNTSVASTIYNINNGFNSNITVNESRIRGEQQPLINDQNAGISSSNRPQQHKPPLIPSLKAKIQQTALGVGRLSSSKSGGGNHTNQLTGATGLTYDERLLMPILGDLARNGSRFGTGANGHSNSVLNAPSMGPLATTPTAMIAEEFIQSRDLQSLVEFKRREDQLTKEFYCAQVPYLFVDHGQIHDYHNHRQHGRNKRSIFSTLNELDQCLSERNVPLTKEKQRLNFDEWQMEMSLKCQRTKVK